MNKIDPNQLANIPENLDDFICKICTFIIQDPHECEGCGTPYCKDCIEAWHKRSSQCPIKCGSTLNIKPAHRFIRKMLNELNVRCPMLGCSEVLKLEYLNKHLDVDCQFLLIKCKNSDCKEYIMRKDIQQHLENCVFKEINCKNCNEIIKINNNAMVDDSEHNCIQILSERVSSMKRTIEVLEKKACDSEVNLQELKSQTRLLLSNISYKCDNAHPLIFKATWTSTCSCCGLIKMCTRWECSTCNKNYCLDCIRLLNHIYCPNFHTFVYGNRGNFLCDICGAKKTHGGPLSLHDPVCDFDLCDTCSVKLFPIINK
jgi:chaperonin cofactor prefoldin